MRIRTRLIILLFAFSVIPLVTLGWLAHTTAKTALSNQVTLKLNAEADNMLRRIDVAFAYYRNNLAYIVKRIGLRRSLVDFNATQSSDSRNNIQQILAELQNVGSEVVEIDIYDAEGKFVVGSIVDDSEAQQTFSYRQDFDNTSADDVHIKLVQDDNGRTFIELASPVHFNDRRVGFAVMRARMTLLERSARVNVGLGDSEEVMMVAFDENGNAARLVPLKVHPDNLPKLQAAENQFDSAIWRWEDDSLPFVKGLDYRNRPVIAVGRRIEMMDLGLLLKVDESEVTRSLSATTNSIWALLGLLTLTVSFASVAIAPIFVKPIVAVTRAVRRFQAGDFDVRIDRKFSGEINELAQAFNDLVDSLDKSHRELERKVEQLRNERERMQVMLHSSPGGIVTMDLSGTITEWNPGAEEILGYSRKDVISKAFDDIVSSDWSIRELCSAALDTFNNSEAQKIAALPTTLEVTHRLGHKVPIELTVGVGEHKGAAAFTIFIRDLTELRRATERDLWFVSFLENSTDAIIGTTLDGNIIIWNDAAVRLFGFSVEEALDQNIRLIIPPDIANEQQCIIDQVVGGEQLGHYTSQRLRSDGKTVEVSLSMSPIRNARGVIIGTATVARDVTSEKAADKRFQLAVEAAPNAMVMVGADGLIQLVNAHTEALFGYDRDELIGRPIEILVPERFRGAHPGFRRMFFGSPEARPMGHGRDLFARRKNGTELPVEIGLNPVSTEEGLVVLSSIVDISERKEAENLVHNSLREKELLLKEIHHRVKNNLQIISSLLKLQSAQVSDRTIQEVFKKSEERVRSMALIHERLYRSEEFANIDLGEYVKELSERLVHSYAADERSVTLEYDLHEVRLGIDRAIPCGLLLNEFVSNALKHAFVNGQGGTLTIRVVEDDGVIVLGVADNGRGLPKDFSIEHTTTLGFEIIRTLIDQLDADFIVERESGMSFEVRFIREPIRELGGDEHGGAKHSYL